MNKTLEQKLRIKRNLFKAAFGIALGTAILTFIIAMVYLGVVLILQNADTSTLTQYDRQAFMIVMNLLTGVVIGLVIMSIVNVVLSVVYFNASKLPSSKESMLVWNVIAAIFSTPACVFGFIASAYDTTDPLSDQSLE